MIDGTKTDAAPVYVIVADKPPPPRDTFQELMMAAEERKAYFWNLTFLFC